MTQESVRIRLIDYLESERGLPQNKVAKLIGVSDSLMSKYKKTKRELWEINLKKLDQFLNGEGF